jgi:hypothetical protein
MDEISKKLSEMTGKDKKELLKKLREEAKEKQTEAEIRTLLEQVTVPESESPLPIPYMEQPEPQIDRRKMMADFNRDANRKFKPKPIAEIRVAETQDEANARMEHWELQRTIKGYFMFGLAIGLPVGFIVGWLIP